MSGHIQEQNIYCWWLTKLCVIWQQAFKHHTGCLSSLKLGMLYLTLSLVLTRSVIVKVVGKTCVVESGISMPFLIIQ